MCFSAGASFAASAVLGTVGVATLTKINDRKQVPFAAIPLIFAVQQATEGVLWIGLSDPEYAGWRHLPVYIFLFFAQVIWPVWVPFSVRAMEKDEGRKKILTVLLVMGMLISSYLLYSMLTYQASAHVSSGHIHYTLQFPFEQAWVRHFFYGSATILPLFVSSVKKMPVLGIAVAISFVVTKTFFEDYVISVWCFFAAILSLIVLGIIYLKNKGVVLQEEVGT